MADAALYIDLPLAGYRTARLTQWSISSDYETPTDGWSVTIDDPEQRALLLRLCGQPCSLSLVSDGAQAVQLQGRVDRVDASGDDELVTLTGRDRISDLTTSHPHPAARAVDGQTLEQLILAMCAPHGFVTVGDDDGALTREERRRIIIRRLGAGFASSAVSGALYGAFSSVQGLTLPAAQGEQVETRTETRVVGRGAREVKDLKPAEMQSVYEYIARIAARTGATVQPSVARDRLELEAPDYAQPAAGKLVRVRSGGLSNVISSSATRSCESLPSVADFAGFGGAKGAAAERLTVQVSVPALLRQIGHPDLVALADVMDDVRKRPGERGDGERLYRYYRQEDKQAKTREAVERLATAAITERLRATLEYEATVPGLASDDGTVWTIGSVVDVDDELCGVREPMWIHSLDRSWSSDSGATTAIRCWRLGTYQVERG